MSNSTKPPTILFMGRIFEVAWGGVREMAEELLRAAAPICAEQERNIEVLVPRAGLTPVNAPAIREVVLPQIATNRLLWDHITVPRYCNRQRNALLYNIKLVLPVGLRIPGFTTLHDLMYFPQPEKYDWREYLLADSLYMRMMVPRTVRRAPFTHCDSHHTARDARALFPNVPPDRFRAVQLGINSENWERGEWNSEDHLLWSELKAAGVREPFVFNSGGLSRRKNVALLIRAFGRFHNRHPDYQLVITGGSKPTMQDPGIEEAVSKLPQDSFIQLGTVSRRHLRLLYNRAAFYVFPSLYEGFGIPALEAQAAECPLICSNATSLPEAAGEGALYFDPRSESELLQKMEELTCEEERGRLIRLGLENASRLTWNRTAEEWLKLADQVYDAGTI